MLDLSIQLTWQPDGMISKSFAFISCIALVNIPQKAAGEAKHLFITYQLTNQMGYCRFSEEQKLTVAKLSPKSVNSKAKTCYLPRKALSAVFILLLV